MKGQLWPTSSSTILYYYYVVVVRPAVNSNFAIRMRSALRHYVCGMSSSMQNGSYWKFADPIGQSASIYVSFYVTYMAKKG